MSYDINIKTINDGKGIEVLLPCVFAIGAFFPVFEVVACKINLSILTRYRLVHRRWESASHGSCCKS